MVCLMCLTPENRGRKKSYRCVMCMVCLTPEKRGIKNSSLLTNIISKVGKGVWVSDSKKNVR